MTKKEIEKMIIPKGIIAKDTFYTLFEIYYIERTGMIQIPDYYDEDTVAAICYNATILFMNKVLEHTDYFEERCKIRERNRRRIRKDLETMELLTLTDDSTAFAKEIVDSLPYKMIIEDV